MKKRSSRSNRSKSSRKSLPSIQDRRRWVQWEISNLMAPPRVMASKAEGLFNFLKSGPVLVAEGDSWFDYPPGMDIVDCLNDVGFNVYSVASAGNTAEDMAYGPDTDQIADIFRRDPSQLAETMRYIHDRRPAAVIFSAGGNDVAGDELASLLNQKNQGGDPLRTAMVNALFDDVIKNAYRTFLRMVQAESKAQQRKIPVIGHGYDYAFPDGRGVINFVGFHFIGPWLAPSLNKKGFTQVEGRGIVSRLIDKHNEVLASLAKEFDFFFPVDLRGSLPKPSDWANELHPTNTGFKRVARKIQDKLKELGITP